MTAPRGVVILHPIRPRELTPPDLAEALAVAERRRVVVDEALAEVVAVLARAMLDRYEP